jgi:hypothetical protein
VEQVHKQLHWNGTSWTNGTNYPVFGYHKGTGTQTAAITLVGQTSPDGSPGSAQTFGVAVNTYNGTSYSPSPSYNTGRRFGGIIGTQTSALYFGGNPPVTGITESWNGSSWTEVNDLNQPRSSLAGAGTQTAGLAFGGNNDGPTNYANTEIWNGTTWTNSPNVLATARSGLGGAGTNRRMVRNCSSNKNNHHFLTLDYYIVIYISLFIINGYIESIYDRKEERH